jgi:hypothetical protein
MAKILDNICIGVSQQLVNTHPTIIQHPDSFKQIQNGYNSKLARHTAYKKISQHLSGEKGEREGLESSPPNGVLQTPVQGGGGKGEITHTTIPYTSFPNPLFRCEEAVLKVGDRVMDVINSFKGTVVGYKDDRVVFDTYELGRYSRPADLLFKLG